MAQNQQTGENGVHKHAAALIDWITDLAGRYVVIIQSQSGARVFLDPSTSPSALYCQDTGRVVSALALLLDHAAEPNSEATSKEGIRHKAT
ncbi:MAG: hypothetical protein N4A61_12600 [Pelagimonas sp.]|jgi:hypothetical protein|nr:hypothetical protein [Pelagimonas sp.]